MPTRNSVRDEVREVWANSEQERRRDKEEKKAEELLRRAGEHQLAEGVASRAPSTPSLIDQDKELDKEAKEAAKTYSTYNEDEQRQLEELFKFQEFTIMEETWRGPQFYETKFLGGNAILDYNMSHDFWVTVYDLVDQLDEPDCDSEEVARKLRTMLDLIMISHGKAEGLTDPTVEYTAEKFIETLRVNWGMYMDTYIKAWTREEGE